MASEVAYTACDCLFVSKNGKPATDPNDEFLSYVRNTSKSIYCFSVSKHERDKEFEPVVFLIMKQDNGGQVDISEMLNIILEEKDIL